MKARTRVVVPVTGGSRTLKWIALWFWGLVFLTAVIVLIVSLG